MNPLVLPAHSESLTPIMDHVVAKATSAGLDKKAIYRLRLAVDEVATNVVKYAYPKDQADATIEVHTQISEPSIAITLVDRGKPFNPHEARMPDVTQDAEDRPIGGLGVYLAIRNVDKFLYERAADQNRNTFVMNRPARATGPER